MPNAERINLIISDPGNGNVYALEQVAEKTFLVWASKDLGETWTKMGTVTPELYRTRQVLPKGIRETSEKLFTWPTLPGAVSLETSPLPSAVLQIGKRVFLFLSPRDNEIWVGELR